MRAHVLVEGANLSIAREEEAALRRAAERSARCHSPPYGLLACRATHSVLTGLLTQLSFTNAGTDAGILIVNVLHE